MQEEGLSCHLGGRGVGGMGSHLVEEGHFLFVGESW